VAKSEYSFDDYLAEARPADFMLRVSADEVIDIPYPTGEQLLQVDESRTARAVLRALCGEKWGRVHALVKDKHAKVMERLADDIREHFGLQGNPGGAGQG
jgi:hypothetical protein